MIAQEEKEKIDTYITEHETSTSPTSETREQNFFSTHSDKTSKSSNKDFNKKMKPLLKGFRMHLKENKREIKKQGQVKAIRPIVSLPQKRF